MGLLGVLGTVDYTILSSAVTDGITNILPTAMTILGAMIGVTIIPRLIYKFM